MTRGYFEIIETLTSSAIMPVSDEDRKLLANDAFLFGTCFIRDGKRIDPKDVFIEPPTKERD